MFSKTLKIPNSDQNHENVSKGPQTSSLNTLCIRTQVCIFQEPLSLSYTKFELGKCFVAYLCKCMAYENSRICIFLHPWLRHKKK